MKNLVQVNTLVKCSRCNNMSGFFVTTPGGADYTCCPLCESYDFLSSTPEINEKHGFVTRSQEIVKFIDNSEEIENDENNKFHLKFCRECRIIFDIGCMHGCNGCTSDVYNAHFIRKWKYRGEEYIGMPQFDDIEEWFQEVNNIEILEMCCPNRGIICDRPGYSKDKYPQYYPDCEKMLKKN